MILCNELRSCRDIFSALKSECRDSFNLVRYILSLHDKINHPTDGMTIDVSILPIRYKIEL